MVDSIAEAAKAVAQAETIFKVAFAKERMTARLQEGRVTEAMAEDIATVYTEAQRLDFRVKEANLTALREELKIATALVDALRTLMASLRNVT